MKKVIIVWSLVNQIGFGVRVNASDADEAEEIVKTELVVNGKHIVCDSHTLFRHVYTDAY